MNEDSNIRIKKNVKKELAKLGSKDDSYNDIIKMLLLTYDDNISFD